MRSSLSVDRGASTASGGNFKVGKCDPPLPPASSAFPSPPFSLSPLHACAGAPPLPLSPRAPPPEQVDRDDRSSPTVELRSPGSSFCWGPELQGSTSPSSSWSSTQRRAGRDMRCAERAAQPPLRAPQPPRPPHARVPHLPAALHRPRLACTPRLHLTPLSFSALLCAGARCRLAPDAASPPMPPRPRCCLAPDAAPDAASPPVAAPDAAPDAPSPRCHPRCLVPPVY